MISELLLLAPEFTLLVMACFILVVDTMYENTDRAITYWLSQLTLLSIAILVLYQYPESTSYLFSGNFILDAMGAVLKFAICSVSLVVFFYSYDYLKEHELLKGEYFVLGLFAVLGMLIMVSAISRMPSTVICLLYLSINLAEDYVLSAYHCHNIRQHMSLHHFIHCR